MTGLLAITMYVIGAYNTGSLKPVREVIPYYDNKYECDIREGGWVSDNQYIADCDGFYLYFDTKELYWERKRDIQFYNLCN